MYQVKDAMTRRVISITPEATVDEAIRLLLAHNITGAPVIDGRGRLCGIITQYQLLEVLYEPTVKNSKVQDCMTREVITVDEDALLGTATNFFVLHRIHRIPVTRNSVVVGILSRQDLLRYFVETGEEIEAFFAKLKQTHSSEALAVEHFHPLANLQVVADGATFCAGVCGSSSVCTLPRNQSVEKWPIGVFASVDAGLGVKLEVAHDLGVPTIQLHAPHQATRTQANADAFLQRLAGYGIKLTCVFGGFEGESYADIPTVARTVGLVPPATRAARTKELKEIADFAKLLGCKAVGLHIGFVPHDRSLPLYKEIVAVARDVCDHCAQHGQGLHLETGQETADDLLAFIQDVERNNLFINFDPANMILYGTGEPIAALKKVGRYVKSVHCKDGKWAKNPGKEWGQEVPLGDGDVGMENYLRTLKEIGYDGPLTIEREIPQEPERQKTEIGGAIKLLAELRKKVLA